MNLRGLQKNPFDNVFLCTTLLFVAAFIIRAWKVDFAAPWADELHSIVYSRTPADHLLNILRDTDIHPPLYFLALKSWFSIFGESLLNARLFSVIFGSACVPLVFLIAKRMYSSRIALFAAIFLCTFPTAIHYAREIRMYPFYTFLFLCTFYLLIRLIDTNREHAAEKRIPYLLIIFFSIFLSATFYTHYTSILLYICYSIFAALCFFQGRKDVFAYLVTGLTLSVFLSAPQIVHLLTNSVGSDDKGWMRATTWAIFYGNSMGAYPYSGLLKLPIFLLLCAGLFFAWAYDKLYFLALLIFTAVGPIIAAVIGIIEPIYLVRTIQVFTILSSILIALTLVRIPKRLGLAALSIVLAINILAATRNFLPNKEHLFIERAANVLALLNPEIDGIFLVDYLKLQSQYASPDIYDRAEHLSLDNIDMHVEQVSSAIEKCLDKEDSIERSAVPQNACRSVVMIIERETKFRKAEVQALMVFADGLAARFPSNRDLTFEDYRVLIISHDLEFFNAIDQAQPTE